MRLIIQNHRNLSWLLLRAAATGPPQQGRGAPLSSYVHLFFYGITETISVTLNKNPSDVIACLAT